MTAIAAIDTALWDIKAKAANMPLYELLGGKSRDGVMVYGHANGGDITSKYMNHIPKLFDTLRDKFGFDVHLLHDAHHRLTPQEAAKVGKSLEPYNLFWLEDSVPAENQEAYRMIRQHTTTPLAVGEVFNSILHLDTAIYNFGVQEYMRHTEKTDEIFPHAYTFKDGYLYPGDTPGHGVDIDEELAAKYPYERAYLPVNRLEDGSMFNW